VSTKELGQVNFMHIVYFNRILRNPPLRKGILKKDFAGFRAGVIEYALDIRHKSPRVVSEFSGKKKKIKKNASATLAGGTSPIHYPLSKMKMNTHHRSKFRFDDIEILFFFYR